ncbi:MATE family efflux transporter [Oscillibacter ruminantium]|uniref:MATE family efflux transporter n=1 Tax=Oscillibacter ruminantium TaxID=1263547 RepID=UPI00058C6B45|nr:MATE family efflux transporter [Oscillibacter ruminantium]MDN0032148.1 MATE family efflux transporter [Oscillibacter valericigenes]
MEERSKKLTENKMGVMPVGKLVFNMSLPIMISMLVQALYNVVDSIFVSRISENALTAVSLAFPMQALMIAVSTGTAVGINALLSRALGARDPKRAQSVALNGIFLAGLSVLAFILIGWLVSPVFFRSQTDVAEIVDGGITYLTICSCVSFGLFFGITFERILQSTGRTLYTMFTQGLGAIINIILDPILIFGLFGLPRMGVAGAAVATVIGQICSMCLSLFFCLKKNPEVPLKFKGFRPNGEIIRDIYLIGVPSIIMQAIGSIMVYGMNRILIPFTTTAATVFGAYFKLQSFIFMPVFGLNNGVIPIVAYNYGAQKKNRIMRAFKVSLATAACIMVVGTLIFLLVPGWLLALFDASDEMLAIGAPALQIISLSFPMAAVGIVCSGVFQALGNSVLSMIVSLARQLILLLPAAWLLSLSGNLDMVWWAFPIAEVVSLILTIVFFRWTYHKHIVPLAGAQS